MSIPTDVYAEVDSNAKTLADIYKDDGQIAFVSALASVTNIKITHVIIATDKRMTKEQAIYDINALIYTVSEVHPNMYAMCNQGEFMSRVNAIEQEMPDTITRATLYKYVAPLLALLGDGHTHVFPPYNDILTKTVLRFPLQVDVDNQSGKITARYSLFGIPKGAEITEINGVSSAAIIANLLQYVSGERPFFRLMKLK